MDKHLTGEKLFADYEFSDCFAVLSASPDTYYLDFGTKIVMFAWALHWNLKAREICSIWTHQYWSYPVEYEGKSQKS